jgi:hypothetical protein
MAAPPTQRAYGSVPIQVDPASFGTPDAEGNQTITVDGLVKVSEEVLKIVNRSGLDFSDPSDHEKIDKLHRKLHGDFKTFATDFPIIFRWIVQTGKFHEEAFRGYMKKDHVPSWGKMWDNKEQMVLAQSEYLVTIRFNDNRKHGKKQDLTEYRKFLKEKLVKENEEFEAAVKEAETVHKKNEADRSERIRQELHRLVLKAAKAKGVAREDPPDH